MIRYKYLVLSALFFICFTACGNKNSIEKQVEALIGSTIVGLDKVNVHQKYTIVHYIDSLGCIPCKLRLSDWRTYTEKIKKEYDDCVKIVFVTHLNAYKDVRKLMTAKEIRNIDIILDENNVWKRRNQIPDNEFFYTLLLDSVNNVLIVGEPFYNDQMEKLYDDILLHNDTVK